MEIRSLQGGLVYYLNPFAVFCNDGLSYKQEVREYSRLSWLPVD